MWSDGSGSCRRPPASGEYSLSASYPHLHALTLQVPEGHPRQACLFQNPLVEVDQVAVSAHGAAAPSALVLAEPAVAPLAYREIRLFLHIVASFWQLNNTTERGK